MTTCWECGIAGGHEIGCKVGAKAKAAQERINRVNAHVREIAHAHGMTWKIAIVDLAANFYDQVELPTEADVAALFAKYPHIVTAEDWS